MRTLSNSTTAGPTARAARQQSQAVPSPAILLLIGAGTWAGNVMVNSDLSLKFSQMQQECNTIETESV